MRWRTGGTAGQCHTTAQCTAPPTQVAASGCVVVASIHQPSSEVFGEFDQLLILSHGQAVYMGAASEATGYFAALAPELQACPYSSLRAVGRWNALRCAALSRIAERCMALLAEAIC